MMYRLCLLFSILIVSGCSTPAPKEPSVIIKYQYVVPEAPTSLYDIPDHVDDIDLNNSTQKDVASWISDRYKRSVILETKIIKLKEYQESTKKIAKEKSETSQRE